MLVLLEVASDDPSGLCLKESDRLKPVHLHLAMTAKRLSYLLKIEPLQVQTADVGYLALSHILAHLASYHLLPLIT